MTPQKAYYKARNSGYSKELEDIVLQSPVYSYHFAKEIKGANIEKLQEMVLQSPKYSYCFALFAKGANIERLQEAVLQDPHYSYWFALYVKGADIELLEKHMGKYLEHYHQDIIRDIIE